MYIHGDLVLVYLANFNCFHDSFSGPWPIPQNHEKLSIPGAKLITHEIQKSIGIRSNHRKHEDTKKRRNETTREIRAPFRRCQYSVYSLAAYNFTRNNCYRFDRSIRIYYSILLSLFFSLYVFYCTRFILIFSSLCGIFFWTSGAQSMNHVLKTIPAVSTYQQHRTILQGDEIDGRRIKRTTDEFRVVENYSTSLF